jgi:hypothetical protein
MNGPTLARSTPPAIDRDALRRQLEQVRGQSLRLTEPLSAEEFRVQSMPDVSPPYWNLGHTSWFFARNVLAPLGCPIGDWPGFDYAFNSYRPRIGFMRACRASTGGSTPHACVVSTPRPATCSTTS